MGNVGIYQIRNLVNDKRYVGSSIDIKKRKREHFNTLKSCRHRNSHLQRAWNKYGENAFIFEVLFTCVPSMCINYEQQVMDQWNPEYNMNPTAGSNLGRKFGDETKDKLRKINTGKKHTKETKDKMSRAHMGMVASDKTKAKISKAALGRKVSTKTKEKLSDAAAGNTHWLGRKHTEETKIKISETKRKRRNSQGSKNPRAKLSELDVYEIRRLYSTGKVTRKVIGKMFKISRVQVGYIIRHKCWEYLQ